MMWLYARQVIDRYTKEISLLLFADALEVYEANNLIQHGNLCIIIGLIWFPSVTGTSKLREMWFQN